MATENNNIEQGNAPEGDEHQDPPKVPIELKASTAAHRTIDPTNVAYYAAIMLLVWQTGKAIVNVITDGIDQNKSEAYSAGYDAGLTSYEKMYVDQPIPDTVYFTFNKQTPFPNGDMKECVALSKYQKKKEILFLKLFFRMQKI